MEIATRVQILDDASCISFHSYSFIIDIDPSLLPPAIGK